MKEIIAELIHSDRWLDNDYKNSNYYREYIDKLCKDLKEKTKKLN
jgi:hypothetical protein